MKLVNKKIWVCDNCGEKTTDPKTFNQADRERGDYCMKCHPKRMTPLQLVEWLAKGFGYVCRQGKDYTTHLDFDFSNKKLGGATIPDMREQLPYSEHNFVVRYFDEDHPRHKKEYWLIPTEEMFLEDCRGKKSKRGTNG